MDDDRTRHVAEAWAARERALAQCDETLAMLRERAAAGPVSAWTVPQPEPPVQRAPQPTPRPPPAPPVASEYSRPQHGPDGRVVGIEKFSGSGAQSAKSWEAWIADYTAKYVARQLDALGAAIADDINAVEARLAKQAATITQLQSRIEQLEARLAGPPRLVEESDAAD